MSRDYGRVSTGFWNHPKIRRCSDQAKLLATYLVTGPHSNACGAYLLPDAYVADDLGWSMQAVSKALAELFAIGFAQRFEDGRHIVICEFLEWNPIANEKVGIGIMKQLALLPDDPAFEHIINGLKPYAKHFPNGLDTLSERLGKPFRYMEQNRADTEQNQKPIFMSADADEIAEAFEAYNLIARDLNWSVAEKLNDRRRASLRARLADLGGLAGWRAAMAKARASPFLRGESGRDKAHESWTPNLDFFLQESSLTKLMEGRYDQRSSNAKPQGFDALREGARRAAGLDTGAGQEVEGSPDKLQRLAVSANGG